VNTREVIGEDRVAATLASLRTEIFADGADVRTIRELAERPYIRGFTTNPTLMRKAGVADYRAFAADVLRAVPNHPVSLEVFSDDQDEMVAQARELASWGPNVNVKIPVTNTEGRFSDKAIRQLSAAGVAVNVTAVMTGAQVRAVLKCLEGAAPVFVSVFAGRIADTGRDPGPIVAEAVQLADARPNTRVIWASPRELLNIFQADAVGCHVITVAHDLLAKIETVGKDLDQFSLETVRMFRDDALRAGFVIDDAQRRPAGEIFAL
jgi:transaldolase